MDFLNLVYLVFTQPRLAFRQLKEGVPGWWAVAVFGGVQLFGQTLNLAWSRDLPLTLPFRSELLASALLLLSIPAALLVWFLEAASWHLLAQLFGGRGWGPALFFALGFAHLPLIFGYGLGAVLRLFGHHGAAYPAALLGSYLWVLVLEILAVQEVHELSAGRSLAVVLLLPAFLGIVALLGLLALWPALSLGLFG